MLSKLRGLIGMVSALGVAGVAGLALSLSSGSALAGVTVNVSSWSGGYKTIDVQGTVAGYLGTDTFNLDTGVSPNTPSSIGSFNQTSISSGADSLTGLIAGQSVQAYCVDLFHTVGSSGTYAYDAAISASNSMASGGDVISSSTMYRWTQTQINELTRLLQESQGVTDGSATAAFQIAIWEVAYDQNISPTLNSGVTSGVASSNNTAMNFTNGISFTGLTSTIAADAENDLADAVNYANSTQATATIWELSNENIAAGSAQSTGATTPQSLIYLVTTAGSSQGHLSPEPGTVGILGTGLAAFWATRRTALRR